MQYPVNYTNMATHTLLLFTIFSLFPFSFSQSPIKAAYWFPASEFPVASIDSTLFTHLFCSFANLDAATNTVTISPSDAAAFSSFTSTVRQKNPSVTTLLSIGGGSSKPADFSSMASQPSTRASFISSSIKLARSNNFQGLDLDWESPTSQADMNNLATLLSEWRSAIASESATPLLLTAAVAFSRSVNGLNYPITSMQANFDWVNVMAYDFYAPNRTPVTSAHAALFDQSSKPSGSSGIASWVNAGLSRSKIVLGLPYYGYAWKLVNVNNHGLGAASTGLASGSGIDTDGTIAFNQIKQFEANNGAVVVYNATVVVNYCYAGSTWIGYDDTEAVAAKVAWAKGQGLRGYFAWSVSGDDDNWILSKKALSTWG